MTIFELEDALVEFVAQQTAELRFRSNESTDELTRPSVWSGFVPRDEVGAVLAGEITTFPAIIVSAQGGVQSEEDTECEIVTANIVVGCFDAGLDQQGYRDCCNLVQLLKDRFREVDIIRQRFPVRLPIEWKMNPHGGGTQANRFPYYFADLTVHFEVPVMASQYETDTYTGDRINGRYDVTPIPTPEPNEHWKHPTPPPVKWVEHNLTLQERDWFVSGEPLSEKETDGTH